MLRTIEKKSITALLLAVAFATPAFSDWGRIQIRNPSNNGGTERVLIENTRIYVDFRYGYRNYNDGERRGNQGNSITDFVNLMVPDVEYGIVQETQAAWMDYFPTADLKGANITESGDSKSVKLDRGCVVHTATIFKGSPVLKMQYEKTCGTIEDRVSPGGKITIGVSYLGGSSAKGVEYKDHIILGGFNIKNGRGVGRIFPKQNATLKAVDHGWLATINGGNFTSWIFTVSGGGEDELLKMGKTLVDGEIPKPAIPTSISTQIKRESIRWEGGLQKLSDGIRITSPLAGPVFLEVLDMQGRKILERYGDFEFFSIPPGSLGSGQYTVKFDTPTQTASGTIRVIQ